MIQTWRAGVMGGLWWESHARRQQRIRRGERKGQFAVKGYYTADPGAKLVRRNASIKSRIAMAAENHREVVVTYRPVYSGIMSLYRMEPYSYRRRGGRVYFFGYDVDDDTIKSFFLSRISKVRISDKRFSPQWMVEIGTKPVDRQKGADDDEDD